MWSGKMSQGIIRNTPSEVRSSKGLMMHFWISKGLDLGEGHSITATWTFPSHSLLINKAYAHSTS